MSKTGRENDWEGMNDMTAIANNIQSILEKDSSFESSYRNYQQKRLLELKKRYNAFIEGEQVDVSDIVENLKSVGILDENGEVAEYYRVDDSDG